MESSDLAGILDSNGRLLDLYGLKKSVFYRVRSHVTLPDTAPGPCHGCACCGHCVGHVGMQLGGRTQLE